METLYIKVSINQSDAGVNEIRNEGLFFSNIADTLDLDRSSIIEIDEENYLSEIKKIKDKFKK